MVAVLLALATAVSLGESARRLRAVTVVIYSLYRPGRSSWLECCRVNA
jgi:hypothetical protein